MTNEDCAIHDSCSGTDSDCRTVRGTRPVCYDGLDLGRAVSLAAIASALPVAGDAIDYADVDDGSKLHEFQRRLRDAGLDLHDGGEGYTVRERSL